MGVGDRELGRLYSRRVAAAGGRTPADDPHARSR